MKAWSWSSTGCDLTGMGTIKIIIAMKTASIAVKAITQERNLQAARHLTQRCRRGRGSANQKETLLILRILMYRFHINTFTIRNTRSKMMVTIHSNSSAKAPIKMTLQNLARPGRQHSQTPSRWAQFKIWLIWWKEDIIIKNIISTIYFIQPQSLSP